MFYVLALELLKNCFYVAVCILIGAWNDQKINIEKIRENCSNFALQ